MIRSIPITEPLPLRDDVLLSLETRLYLKDAQRIADLALRSLGAISRPRRCHVAILDRGGTAVIPIRRNGRLWKENCPAARTCNDILCATRRLGRAN